MTLLFLFLTAPTLFSNNHLYLTSPHLSFDINFVLLPIITSPLPRYLSLSLSFDALMHVFQREFSRLKGTKGVRIPAFLL